VNGWVYGEHILPGDGVRARELKETEKRRDGGEREFIRGRQARIQGWRDWVEQAREGGGRSRDAWGIGEGRG
jgi:hypothetical protein